MMESANAKHCSANRVTLRRLLCSAVAAMLFTSQPLHAEPMLEHIATPFRVATAAGDVTYFVAHEHSAQPRTALVVMHGHPRDAAKTLQAAISAAQAAGAGGKACSSPRCSRCRRNLPLAAIPPVCPSRKTVRLCGAAAPGSKAIWIIAGKPARSMPWITCWPT